MLFLPPDQVLRQPYPRQSRFVEIANYTAVLSPVAYFAVNFLASFFGSSALAPNMVLLPLLVAPLAVPPLLQAWSDSVPDYTLELKRSFARLAAWAYFAMFHSLGALVFVRATEFPAARSIPPVIMMTLTFAVFAFAALNYTVISHPTAGWSPLLSRLTVGALAGTISLAMVPQVESRQFAANEAGAIQSVSAIASAENRYALAHPSIGFAPSLASLQLGPDNPGIDSEFAQGQKGVYEFQLYANEASAASQTRSFFLVARPRHYADGAVRSFYTDNSGIIRFTSENRPATIQDPALN